MNIYPIPGCISLMTCSGSHLVGALVFTILSFYVMRHKSADPGCKVAVGIFGFTCVFLLAASTVYHFLPLGGAGHDFMRRIDHAAIFALIAGSFTPVQWILFRSLWRWGILLLVWVLALFGIMLEIMFFETIPEAVELAFYFALGWIGLVPAITLWRRFGFLFIQSFVYGGLAYTLGGLVSPSGLSLTIPGVIGPHELLHLAVLVGISCHWLFVLKALEKPADRWRDQLKPPDGKSWLQNKMRRLTP